MILVPTQDMAKVKAFMIQPEVWERASEDYEELTDFYPHNDDLSVWLECLDEKALIGMVLVHHDNSTTLRIHPYMTSKTKGRDMMKELFGWVLLLPDQIQKIIVSIPTCHRIAYNFAKKVGFIDEGINRLSYTKGGELYDQWNLGLTRKEIEAL